MHSVSCVFFFFFFSSRRRHTRFDCDWSSDVCSSDLAPPYTPAPGARDLRSVLHNWGWHLGMLRGEAEIDLIASLEYQGKGTMQVGGQPCNVTKYRSSINYQVSGERIQLTGTRPNGQSCSTIEVLSGAYAWNEDIPGA